MSEYAPVTPEVNAEAEFFEILNDFGDPRELLREGLSNAFDAKATRLDIHLEVRDDTGPKRLVIRLSDNGRGMSRDVLARDFWGLGHSQSRGDATAIGEKGHGTKIFLRSERVVVRTQTAEGAHESVCDAPFAALSMRKLHEPRIREIPPFRDTPGTEIEIIGYNDNERQLFRQEMIRDYLRWFTKLGSIEKEFNRFENAGFVVALKSLDHTGDAEILTFGHEFAPVQADIEKLFETRLSDAADHYCRKWTWQGLRLPKHPEVAFDLIICVEGDAAKREYNKMLRDRGRTDKGTYAVRSRYGLWLAKDYIPIERVNEWVGGFGRGSNAFVLLHAFANCQHFRLTANRKSIANTDPRLLEDMQEVVQSKLQEVDSALSGEGLYTLLNWQEEERTKQEEVRDFAERLKKLKSKQSATLDDRRLLEPRNESELFGLLVTLTTLRPTLFEFELLDYNTSRGIDFIARNRSGAHPALGEHWYIELKHNLQRQFNHSFENLRWLVCWDFGSNVIEGSDFVDIGQKNTRRLRIATDSSGYTHYFLESALSPIRIQVIRLREFLAQRAEVTFSS